MKRYSNFDLLLCAAAEQYSNKELERILSVDTSSIDAQIKEKTKNIRKSQQSHLNVWRIFKVAAVACLTIMSMAFTACVCIPEVREAIYDVVIEWYEDHIGVSIETTEQIPVEPPSSIQQKAYTSYLDDSYRCEISVDNETIYALSYYNVETDEWRFMLKQTIISGDWNFADAEGQSVMETTIGNKNAVIETDESIPGFYTLHWRDDLYEYSIYGQFDNVDDLLRIASGVKLKTS